MKSKLLLFGFALAALPATAQDHVADKYNRSVFAQFHNIRPNERVNMGLSQQKVQQHFPGMKVSIDKLTGHFTDIFGFATSIPGNSVQEKVQNCFAQHLTDFGINPNQWQQTEVQNAEHASFVNYEQLINGHKVAFSRLQFRFTKDSMLERLQMKNFGTPDLSLVPSIGAEDAKLIATKDLNDLTVTESKVSGDWLWFPVPMSSGYNLRPAYKFEVYGQGEGTPVELTGYIDAISGHILYRNNEVKEIDRTVKGTVYKQNPFQPATNEALPNLMVTVNSTNYYTDTAGKFNNPSLPAPVYATVKLEGRWSKVRAAASSNVTPSYQDTILTSGSTVMFPIASPSSNRHVNAYYHVNVVHDFMKKYMPTFTQMDYPLQTNVDVTGSCNAYYTSANGGSINFYAAGGGCNSFALCGDIIYHEYGHAISGKFYGGMNNGALNEGNSDVWGMGITNNPVLGIGMNSNPGSFIRRYDQSPKVFPKDIKGEVHADGEIIAGAWWDVRLNLNSLDTMTQLFTKTYYDKPDGPNGTEGDVYHQVLISALINDDNDANLNNGTPHFSQIVAAFAKHGIYLLGDAVVAHTEIPHQPANTTITISTSLAVSTPGLLGDVKLFYRARGSSWDSLIMTNTGGSNYSVQLPGKPEGTMMDYYFVLYDFTGMANGYFPEGYKHTLTPSTVTIPYQFGVGILSKATYDFETTLNGWTIGNAAADNAVSGLWIQAKPIGSYLSSVTGQIPVQPNMDHTTGASGKCLVTGNAASTTDAIGTEDVDGATSNTSGKTTVITPVFDLSGYSDPVIEYYRWFSNDKGNNPGQDYWLVQIKDSSSSTWVAVDNTKQSDHAWRRRIFRIKEYPTIANSQYVKMQFVAEDASPGSIYEAAIDDIFIYDKASTVQGISNVSEMQKASIYPNPANNEVYITLPYSTNGFVGLYDLTGKEIKRIGIGKETEYLLNTSDIAAGTYFILIQTKKSIQTQKISVLH